jgi:hypothetical protein
MYILYMIFICIYHPSLWTFTCFGGTPCLIVYAPESRTLSNYRVRLVSGKKKNNYNIDGSTLEEVEHHPYLGVELGNDLNWNHHIDQTTTKVIVILAFLRRNLKKCSKEVKEKAYTTLIRPNLEYRSSVWDPFRRYQIDAVEMVQRRAARFVTGQYNRYQSVTSMLQELKWTSLQQRRQEQRLVNLYKCVNNINALQIPPYVVRPTRRQNSNSFIPISCNNDSYKYSYFPMTLLEWNNLPEGRQPENCGDIQDLTPQFY